MENTNNFEQLERRVVELTKRVSAIKMPKNSLYDQIYEKMINNENAKCGNC